MDRHRVQEQLERHPNTVPMIIETDDMFYKHLNTKTAATVKAHLETTKYAPPRDWRVAELMTRLRQRIELPSKYALFILLNSPTKQHILPCVANTLGDLYDEHKHPEDGMLWAVLTVESTFG